MTQAARNLSVQQIAQTKPELNMRVLVVDDEKSIAEGIKHILMPDEGAQVIPLRRSSRQSSPSPEQVKDNPITLAFQVTVVHTAADALQAVKNSLAQGTPFSMGFFDVLLGEGMDGIQLVKEIQSLDPHIYSVFVTAYQDRSVQAIGEVLGSNNIDRWDYINKPFSEGEILQKARMMTRVYHLQRESEWQQDQIAQAHQFVLENERMNTVAAVGRSVAHEFGNLLMQIVGNADIALLKQDPERMKSALQTILKASDTASAILGRFKKISNQEGSSNERKPVNVTLALNEAVDLMSYQFRKSSIQVIRNKMEESLIHGNHHALVQVFMNLFINAVHAMPTGGAIELTCQKQDGGVCIKVRDHGMGISPENIDKVTEPLFTTKGNQGTGLGLAICKEIIEIEHHGKFSISNHSEKGVEVTLWVPYQIDEGGKYDKP